MSFLNPVFPLLVPRARAPCLVHSTVSVIVVAWYHYTQLLNELEMRLIF